MKTEPTRPAIPYDHKVGDRIIPTHAEAMRRAQSRALKRGRQRVTVRPPSRFIHYTTFFVQDIR